jgi:hypothetical protein
MRLVKVFCVKVKENFYKEDKSKTKYFTNEDLAINYLDSLSNTIWKVPGLVLLEENVGIVDNDSETEKVYLLETTIT